MAILLSRLPPLYCGGFLMQKYIAFFTTVNAISDKRITASGSGNPTKRRTAFFVTSSGIYDRGITVSGNK